MQDSMDTWQDSLIKAANAIRGQEHETSVILDRSQEDRNDAIALDIPVSPRFQEYISFIEKENTIPKRSKV